MFVISGTCDVLPQADTTMPETQQTCHSVGFSLSSFSLSLSPHPERMREITHRSVSHICIYTYITHMYYRYTCMWTYTQWSLTATRKEQKEPPYSNLVCPNMGIYPREISRQVFLNILRNNTKLCHEVLWTVKVGINHAFQSST